MRTERQLLKDIVTSILKASDFKMAGGIIQKEIKCLDSSFTQDILKNVSCPYCEEHGFYERLGPRILKPNESVPEDYDNWKQCTACGRVSPTYILRYESELQDIVDVVENPFDVGPTVLGNENKKKLRGRQKELKKLKDRINKEKDPDIAEEIRKHGSDNVCIIQ